MVSLKEVEFAAQMFYLKTRGHFRCLNLIIHPNGRIYGDGSRLSCPQWLLHDGQIYFVDRKGRVRFIFAQGEDGTWNYAPANPTPGQMVQYTMALGERGQVNVATPSAAYQLLPQTLPEGKRHFEIVVAKYKEDVTWTDAILRHVTIYSKDAGDRGKYPVLANLGREGGTYFHHVVTRYDDLAERTLFLQGDPFPHSLRAFSDYATDSAGFTSGPCERSHIKNSLPWSSPAQRIDQAAMVDFLRLAECDPNMTEFSWVQGAQFAVSRERIRRRPLAYYQRMHELTQQEKVPLTGRHFDNHHVAWIFELFWRQIFSETA